ncbi:MAG: hypothetical protein ACRDK2_13155 [Solirubrobacteraceae bacterium]
MQRWDSLVWGNAEVKEAHLLLSNESVPGANGFGGSLLEPSARGTQELDLTATDPNGPGVYSVTVEVEGSIAYTGTPNINDDTCTPTGITNSGVLMFTTPQPCLQTEAVKLPVETAGVPDGQHPVQVKITDAAGNSKTVFAGNITTHNAPVASTVPTILAPNGVSTGVALSSTPGQWSAPSGAGTITDIYQWQQCSATGKECQAIPGATAATYTPTQADAGHTLKLAVTGVNYDGKITGESAATGIVAAATGSDPSDPPNDPPSADPATTDPGAPNGINVSSSASIELSVPETIARKYSDRALHIPGKLVSSTGEPIVGATIEVLVQDLGSSIWTVITHTTTGGGGAFVAKIPAGPLTSDRARLPSVRDCTDLRRSGKDRRVGQCRRDAAHLAEAH